ncbi:MAG: vanadium-dependent haloperoxidase [Ferruginibacter sp.]
MKKLSTIILLSMLWAACKQPSNEYKNFLQDSKLFTQTVYHLNEVVMGNNFPPMVASRNYVYGSIAAYEVMAAAHPDKYYSLGGQLNGLSPLDLKAADAKVNYELAALMAFIKVGEAVTFPEGSMKEYKDSIVNLARQKGLPEDVEKASQQFADQVGSKIIAWSKKDNYLQTRSAEKYTVLENRPERWVPTPPGYFPAAEPHWDKIRPMVIDSAGIFAPPPPLEFNATDKNSPYYQEVIKIKNAIDSLTPEQQHVAMFWDDNPFKINVEGHVMFSTKKFSPPGHWMSISGIAANTAKADFATAVQSAALTSIALFDAFIECWYVKYKYNTVRPETVINKYIDQEWRPYLQTPAFPEYTCGHSTISAAAAEALTSVYGDNFAYTDSTELEFGIKNRSFKSFREAALENNWARFYGGIHYHQSCIVSTEIGKNVGALIVRKLKTKK